MLLFYLLSSAAGTDPCRWYQGSIVRLLFPDAGMAGSGPSDFLREIGTDDMRGAFLESWISFVSGHFRKDHVILADGSAFPAGSMRHIRS